MRTGGYTLRIYDTLPQMYWDLLRISGARILRRRLEEHKRTRKIWEEDEDLDRKGISGLLKLTYDLKRKHMRKVKICYHQLLESGCS